MPRTVVFDTNILLSALLSLRGSPFQCLALAKLGVIQSVTCPEILDEFSAKLRTKFAWGSGQAGAAVAEVQSFSRLVTITNTLKVVTADPADDKIVECALVGRADYLITGDRRHLLPLGKYQNIVILGATEFLTLVSAP